LIRKLLGRFLELSVHE